MTARDQLPPERDRREGVPGLAEGGEQKAAPVRFAQSDSASARTISVRPSGVVATGLAITVPTPASR